MPFTKRLFALLIPALLLALGGIVAGSAAPAQSAPLAQRHLPVPEAPRSNTEMACLDRNPSCGRDPWWEEWNEVQESSQVTCRFAPGLVTETRYIEAVWLLWQWPQGQHLITS